MGSSHALQAAQCTSLISALQEQYLETTLSVSNRTRLFGLGERTQTQGAELPRDGLPAALWAVGTASLNPRTNLYSSWPFFLQLPSLTADGTASGILLLNSNGMDVAATGETVRYSAVGGVLDFFIFMGPTPADVLEQLTRVVGRPTVPPFWSNGFHQCKFGYKDVYMMEEVVANYSAAGIPLDTMWFDIDHMYGYRDFTFDAGRYPQQEVRAFVDRLHADKQHAVIIIEGGVKIDAAYQAFVEGLKRKAYIQDLTGNPYVGQVWPGPVHFVDFLSSNGTDFWADQLTTLYSKVPWDGLWIDMNEVSNFCTGQPDTTTSHESLIHPPFDINNGNQHWPLSSWGAGVTASHADGILEYDVHNLYGLSEAVATNAAMQKITGNKPFLLSRSSFPGSGAVAMKWTGDNAATWHDLQWTISSVLLTGLVGIPDVGTDICGFVGHSNEELCARWISVGAFQPFARSHSDLHAGFQELYRWNATIEAGRKALGLRYRLLPHINSAFQESHRSGLPVARPLWMDFPKDPRTHTVNLQWMFGKGVLVTPVVEKGARNVTGYFPAGKWYSLFDNSSLLADGSGRDVTLTLPLGEVGVHQQGGTILAFAQPSQRAGG
eukprot:jgi/Astpho2/7647/e_gw1.00115.13.1_t